MYKRQIDDARKKNAAAKSQLLLAGRAIRRQLESVVLPTGEEGALVSRLLEAEAARLGLVWQTGTRGEEFRPAVKIRPAAWKTWPSRRPIATWCASTSGRSGNEAAGTSEKIGLKAP